MINLILFPVSIIPTIIMIVWLLKKVLVEEKHSQIGRDALMHGFKSTLWVMLFSLITVLLRNFVLTFINNNEILKAFYHNFITLALAEEIAKGFMLQKLLKKYDVDYTWLDIIVYMTIIAIGFSILESAMYAITTNPVQIIVRGLTFPHLDLGMIMGYFAGKAMKDNNKFYYVLAVIIPWILHGAYDFCLDDCVLALSNWVPYIPVTLALFSLVMAIVFVIFVLKHKNNPKYTVIVRRKSDNN